MNFRHLWWIFPFLALTCGFAAWLAWSEANREAFHLLLEQGGPLGFFVFTIMFNVLVIPFPYDPFVAATPWLYPGLMYSSLAAAVIGTQAAAMLAYALGDGLRTHAERWFGRHRKYPVVMEKLHKYGWGAVALSAVTPLPFSLVCWGCGISRTHYVAFLLAVFVSRAIRNGLVWYLAWHL